jgi:hypothetical protein
LTVAIRIHVVIKLIPRPMAAKFQVEIGEPGEALYVVGLVAFLEIS